MASEQKLVGVVVQVDKPPEGRRNKLTTFTLKGSVDGKIISDYRCTCPFFCWLREGDQVEGFVELESPTVKIATFLRLPLVRISVEKKDVINDFHDALRWEKWERFGISEARRLYENMVERASFTFHTYLHSRYRNRDEEEEESGRKIGEVEQVITYLSVLTARHFKYRSNSIIDELVGNSKLTEKQSLAILRWWHNNRLLRGLYLLNLTKRDIKRCQKKESIDAKRLHEMCMENPSQVISISLEKAGEIAKLIGKEMTHEEKYCCGIKRAIVDYNEKGWTCAPLNILCKKFPDLHRFQKVLQRKYDVKFEYNNAYLSRVLNIEKHVAIYINKLIRKTAKQVTADATELKEEIKGPNMFREKTPDGKRFILNDEQRNAIRESLKHQVCFITGGAGTGKSTVIRELVWNLENRCIPFAITSFTGKAVCRLQEVLMNGQNAATMHRMINQNRFADGKEDVTLFKHLIIDELSMVTTELFYSFIISYTHEYKITFVGDQNQLQPIGWGCLMKELLECQRIPNYVLSQNLRINQDLCNIGKDKKLDGGSILRNANNLIDPKRNLGRPLIFDIDGSFVKGDGDEGTVRKVLERFKAKSIGGEKITILCPYKRDLPKVNKIFQEVYLAGARSVSVKDKLWYVGDRVMMTVNNYEIDVFNGEEGEVIDINAKGVTVRFTSTQKIEKVDEKVDEKKSKTVLPKLKQLGDKDGGYRREYFFAWEKEYEVETVEEKEEKEWREDNERKKKEELTVSDIAHSVAKTVHKSQGSEYDFVIGYVSGKENWFLNVNLLYVLITRARKEVWLIGPDAAIDPATTRLQKRRYDGLALRLRELQKLEDPALEADLVKLVKSQLPEVVQEEEYEHEDMSLYEQ